MIDLRAPGMIFAFFAPFSPFKRIFSFFDHGFIFRKIFVNSQCFCNQFLFKWLNVANVGCGFPGCFGQC